MSQTKEISLHYNGNNFRWYYYKQGLISFIFTRILNGDQIILGNEGYNQRISHVSFLLDEFKFGCYKYNGVIQELDFNKWLGIGD